MMTYTHERGSELFSELSALKAPPPISGPERIHFHSLIGPGVTTGPAYHITEYFWYGIEVKGTFLWRSSVSHATGRQS